MSSFLTGVVVILLGILVYQDFRFRSISWLLLPALFVLSFTSTCLSGNFMLALKYSVYNSLFLLFQLTMVLLYFLIRYKTIKNFTRNILGWGDVLFFFAITPLFSLPLYLLFLITGMLLTLVLYFIMSLFRNLILYSHPIPLAGILAALLIVLQLFQWFYPQIVISFNTTIATAF